MLAGVLAGAYDILINATAAYGDRKYLLMSLYGVSGVLGVGISVVAFTSMSSLFWPILIASFLTAMAIAYVNNSALKVWISHCQFGLGEKYSSFDKELKGYQEVVGA